MKKKYFNVMAAALLAGSFLMSCSSTATEGAGSNYTGAEGTEKTISDGGDVPVEGTPENDPAYIDHTDDANPPGDQPAGGTNTGTTTDTTTR